MEPIFACMTPRIIELTIVVIMLLLLKHAERKVFKRREKNE